MMPLPCSTRLLLLALLFCTCSILQAAPRAKLWERWTNHDPASILVIDHAAWDGWLKRFVKQGADGINRVDYAAVDNAARSSLRNYIDTLTGLDIGRYARNEQKAYWINLYNALTVEIVLENFPLESIRDISSGLFSSGPWNMKLATIQGEAVSLDDIEHRILRPIWRDPRIHYAVNCASLGCPNLQMDAFTVQNLDVLLDRAAREYINHPRGARVVDGKVEVSSIYDWFEDDFGGNDAGVIAHLKLYAEDDLAAALAGISRVGDDDYDWRINATKSTD